MPSFNRIRALSLLAGISLVLTFGVIVSRTFAQGRGEVTGTTGFSDRSSQESMAPHRAMAQQVIHKAWAGANALKPSLQTSFDISATDVSPEFDAHQVNVDGGGRMYSIVVAPQPVASGYYTVFVASELSGVWKSVDSGATWRQSSQGITWGKTLPGIHSLAIDEQDPRRLVYATKDDNLRVVGRRAKALWYTVDEGVTWNEALITDSKGSVCTNDYDIGGVTFGQGRAYAISYGCGGVYSSIDLRNWQSLQLPLPIMGTDGANLQFLVAHKRTIFLGYGYGMPNGGTITIYRGIIDAAGAVVWSSPQSIQSNKFLLDLQALPVSTEISPSVLVVYNYFSASRPMAPDVLLLNFETDTVGSFRFPEAQALITQTNRLGPPNQFQSSISGGRTVSVVRRAGSLPESFDVYLGNSLQFFELTRPITVGTTAVDPSDWIIISEHGADQLIHDDPWGMAFASDYDGTKQCAMYAASDGGFSIRQTCDPYSWRSSNSGLHGFKSGFITGAASNGCDTPALCTWLYVPSGDNGTIYSPSGGLPARGGAPAWFSLRGGDSGFASIDSVYPNELHVDGYIWRTANPAWLPTRTTPPIGLDRAGLVGGFPPAPRSDSLPPQPAIARIMTVAGERAQVRTIERTPQFVGDFLAVKPSQSGDAIVRSIGGMSWSEISLTQRLTDTLALAVSGGHANPVVYALGKLPDLPQGSVRRVYRSEINAAGVITGWRDISNSQIYCSILPGAQPVNLQQPVNLIVNPYDPNVIFVSDIGAGKIRSSYDGGQCWENEDVLTNIATNNGEFLFQCDGRINDGDRFCPLEQVLFPFGDSPVRVALLFPGGVAASADGGRTWLPIHDNWHGTGSLTGVTRLSDLLAYPMSGFLVPSSWRPNGLVGSSLYLALTGRGLVRLDFTAPTTIQQVFPLDICFVINCPVLGNPAEAYVVDETTGVRSQLKVLTDTLYLAQESKLDLDANGVTFHYEVDKTVTPSFVQYGLVQDQSGAFIYDLSKAENNITDVQVSVKPESLAYAGNSPSSTLNIQAQVGFEDLLTLVSANAQNSIAVVRYRYRSDNPEIVPSQWFTQRLDAMGEGVFTGTLDVEKGSQEFLKNGNGQLEYQVIVNAGLYQTPVSYIKVDHAGAQSIFLPLVVRDH